MRKSFAALILLCSWAHPSWAEVYRIPAGDVAALIQALDQANAAPGPHTIILAPGTYTLTAVNNEQVYYGNTGLPLIAGPVHVLGPGPDRTIIQRAGDGPLFRFFRIVAGGRLTLEGLTLTGGRTNIGDGGAILNEGAVTLVNVALTNNASVLGGAIDNDGSLALTDSSLTSNGAMTGGAICNGLQAVLDVRRSLFSNNSAWFGGAIESANEMTVANSTLSGNLGNYAISSLGKVTNLVNVTLVGNYGGLSALYAANVKNTILSDNVRNCGGYASYPVINSLGHNLDSDGSCLLTGPGDITGSDPQVGPLVRNFGARTATHALLPGSPAMDAGDNAGCPATDQRGVPRPQDATGGGSAVCDMGAFEVPPGMDVRAIEPTADAHVRSDLEIRENDNYGMQGVLIVGTGRDIPGSPDAMRSLVRFDLSDVPRVPLQSAVLELTVHGYDHGSPASDFRVEVHRLLRRSFRSPLWEEGDGYEGAPGSGPPGSVDPDESFGVAWAGGADNPDPHGANNTTQPPFAAGAAARVRFNQGTTLPGSIVRWNVTSLAQGWLDGSIPNAGVALIDSTTDGLFRGVLFGSREAAIYNLVDGIAGPRLVLRFKGGDTNGDGIVDRQDLQAILRALFEPAAGPLDPRDLDGDGRITVFDAIRLLPLCNEPRCGLGTGTR
jgi:hypothetical protein